MPSIHRSAWNRNSPKFTVASAADYSLASAERRGAWPQLVARRGDLAPCVTPLCSKRLRLATLQLPEKSLRYKSGAKPASRKVGGWYLAKDAPRRVVQAEGDPLLRRGALLALSANYVKGRLRLCIGSVTEPGILRTSRLRRSKKSLPASNANLQQR